MGLAATKYEHVVLDERSTPVIAGANTKVVELVTELHAHGWSPAELHFQHPHLTLGQIHSALAYYWDHKEALDNDMRRRFEEAEKLRLAAPVAPVAERLRQLKQSGWPSASTWITTLRRRSPQGCVCAQWMC
jgi:uncharacterized protein (DUF433 family)